ncbi:hypothetical protein [Kineosporia babensis]|uniref:Uncharacterized protein n=1 Tax=Kineosporia babensis TaxID=499548 RepID=A0A9X1NHM0_9ACTN|nr:hypothetical protein [Kineosporia babensis]MCD5314303.1 hypothetical protein [Kineosporia babensis]
MPELNDEQPDDSQLEDARFDEDSPGAFDDLPLGYVLARLAWCGAAVLLVAVIVALLTRLSG